MTCPAARKRAYRRSTANLCYWAKFLLIFTTHIALFVYALTAVICGATSYAKVEMFGKSKEKWLKKYLKLENGIPDACTFRNVIRSIDTQRLHTEFMEWMRNVVEHVTGVVAIDGKQTSSKLALSNIMLNCLVDSSMIMRILGA